MTKAKRTTKTYDLRVVERKKLICPDTLRKGFPDSSNAQKTVLKTRQEVEEILQGKSSKIIVIAGPCSIHCEGQAMLYGKKFLNLKEEVKDTMLLIMRTYFEKPRTIFDWEGIINDPFLNQNFDINEGIFKARNILLRLNEMGIPCSMEMLSQITAERLTSLLSWICVGARTCESPIHRKWASALSTAVGFKNGTNGQINIAINAILAAAKKSAFTGHDKNGKSCIIKSKGNPFCHIVLRGGERPNYDPVSIGKTISAMQNVNVAPNIFIDCSHDNSGKKHKGQKYVWNNSVAQILEGNNSIKGLMLESSISEGKQEFVYGKTKMKDLNNMQSITDECIGFKETEDLLFSAHEHLLTYNKKL